MEDKRASDEPGDSAAADGTRAQEVGGSQRAAEAALQAAWQETKQIKEGDVVGITGTIWALEDGRWLGRLGLVENVVLRPRLPGATFVLKMLDDGTRANLQFPLFTFQRVVVA